MVPKLANLQPHPTEATLPLLDRTGRKHMAFGAFAESIGERAEPRDAQEEIYVGLEHLDPQCLHIRRWGKGIDVTGTKLRFRKGDTILGRRRAHQRKVAVAEFDGICRTQKPKARRGKILFINAVNDVTRERAQSFLTDEPLQRVVRAYQSGKDEHGFSRIVPLEEIRAKEGNLSIPLYITPEPTTPGAETAESNTSSLPSALASWLESSRNVRHTLTSLLSAK